MKPKGSADMASEMQRYTVADINAKVGQSILAQANQSRQWLRNLLGEMRIHMPRIVLNVTLLSHRNINYDRE